MAKRSLPYSLAIVLRNRSRYLPAVLAVAFSAILISLQGGLLLGLLEFISLPIDNSSADIWVTTRHAESLTLAQPVPEAWALRLSAQPEINRVETYLQGFGSWHKPGKGSQENCCVIGTRLDADSLGAITSVAPEVRALLTEPGTVLVDEQELEKLGLKHGRNEVAEINKRRVRVVGTVKGFQGFTAPYVFCSMQTARMLLPTYQEHPELTMHVLARCKDSRQAAAVAQRLHDQHKDMATYTADAFSFKTKLHWLFRTAAGTVMICTVFLALLVGLVVTRQTLYAAASAAMREYGVLDALGIPRRRLAGLVLAQSFWIGLTGLVLAVPLIYALSLAAQVVQTKVLLPPWLLGFGLGITLLMALVSGVSALRSLRQIEPALLLR
jgi:putative ABC transport system permease protein